MVIKTFVENTISFNYQYKPLISDLQMKNSYLETQSAVATIVPLHRDGEAIRVWMSPSEAFCWTAVFICLFTSTNSVAQAVKSCKGSMKQEGKEGGKKAGRDSPGRRRQERRLRGAVGGEAEEGAGEGKDRRPKEGNTTPNKLSQAVVLSWTGKHFQPPTNGRHRVLE